MLNLLPETKVNLVIYTYNLCNRNFNIGGLNIIPAICNDLFRQSLLFCNVINNRGFSLYNEIYNFFLSHRKTYKLVDLLSGEHIKILKVKDESKIFSGEWLGAEVLLTLSAFTKKERRDIVDSKILTGSDVEADGFLRKQLKAEKLTRWGV